MKIHKVASLLLFAFLFNLTTSCSSSDDSDPSLPTELPTIEAPIVIDPVITEDPIIEDPVIDTNDSNLEERFVFKSDLVIENSYNTGGCESPPCNTIDESLVDVFVNTAPNDPYFYLSADETELNLECQLEKGRRIEFKQISRGPLTSFSQLTFEGTYYDIPNNGVTIAQVHNRGGTSNKPFFRLVLHKNGLETVIRKDPEVSSSQTSFKKEDFSFVDGADYDLSPLKIVLEKNNGFVNISVEQNGVLVLDESYTADPTTDWVNDTGIANGFYLKAGLYNDDGPHTKSLVAGYSTVIYTSED